MNWIAAFYHDTQTVEIFPLYFCQPMLLFFFKVKVQTQHISFCSFFDARKEESTKGGRSFR